MDHDTIAVPLHYVWELIGACGALSLAWAWRMSRAITKIKAVQGIKIEDIQALTESNRKLIERVDNLAERVSHLEGVLAGITQGKPLKT